MANVKARIFNERLKMFTGTMNTLASAVLVLSFFKRQIEEVRQADIQSWAPSEALDHKFNVMGISVVSLEPDVNIIWLAGAVATYGVSLWATGLMRDES